MAGNEKVLSSLAASRDNLQQNDNNEKSSQSDGRSSAASETLKAVGIDRAAGLNARNEGHR